MIYWLQRRLRKVHPAAPKQQQVRPSDVSITEPPPGDSVHPTRQEQHAFLDAAQRCDFALVRDLVIRKPGLVNCQPAGRWSALHQAAYAGRAQAVQFLLAHGASTTLRARDGLTPLDVAKDGVVELLLVATSEMSSPSGAPGPGKPGDPGRERLVDALPSYCFAGPTLNDGGDDDDDANQCQICLEGFANGDKLRKLPCSHFFHARCVDVWLKEKCISCPTCRSTLA